MSGHAVADRKELFSYLRDVVEGVAGKAPVQGKVTSEQRQHEAERIVRWWPKAMLVQAERTGATWHSLYEPARWADQGDVNIWHVVDFCAGYSVDHGRWPNIRLLRQTFGKAPNHRVPGDQPDQGSLL